ncbi:hypothetical protein [Conexibacter sp. SYSU D00693]|uniref:hypothetical protein n=1 Tax=Conexibacter sp. SYSU D00693 TaxID=2812560 RepID=UPI00196AE113|nr:hypothetical protein [Conexibacter sp. SYSU D00693]
MLRALAGALVAATALAACGEDAPPATVAPSAPEVAPATAPATPALRAACREGAATVREPVRCPLVVPATGAGYRRPRMFDLDGCTYLLDLEARGVRARNAPFHVLLGGRCRPFDLRTRHGRWPVASVRDDLRVVGRAPQRPGGGGGQQVPLTVLGRPRVLGRPALLVRAAPYPAGGMHGGHVLLVHNVDGAGYVVSAHTLPEGRTPATPQLVATLVDVAERSRPLD